MAALVAAALVVGGGVGIGDARQPAGLTAGAAVVDVALPDGVPLAGYGGYPRRALVPDILGRLPHAFWLRPSLGVHDPIRVRGLVLESGTTRVLWLTVDLIGIDPALVSDLAARLRAAGLAYSAVLVSASHTHSGPGAFADSAVFGVIALDRLSPPVKDSLVAGLERAARSAESRKEPAQLAVGRSEVAGIAESRVDGPLDTELGLLKLTGVRGRPIAVVWNYAIHGTALGRDNFLLSGDIMADASHRVEQELGVPVLFVNGAVGDVSPRPRGWAGVAAGGAALADGVLAAWAGARRDPRPRLQVATERVSLPAPYLSLRNCLADWIPPNLMLGLADVLPAEAEVMALGIGSTAWVTIPGELETRLGLDLKAAAGGPYRHVFVAGLTNNYLGYFLTPAAYRRASYIACASLYGEHGGEIIRDAALNALKRLGAGAPARSPAPGTRSGS